MTDKKLYDLLNDRMIKEFESAYFYFDLQNQTLNMHFQGYAKLLEKFSIYHLTNAKKYRDLIINLEGLPMPKTLEQGREKKFSSILEIAKASLRKEKENSRAIDELIWYASDNKHWLVLDIAKQCLLQQVNAQNQSESVSTKWDRAKDENWLDSELGNTFI